MTADLANLPRLSCIRMKDDPGYPISAVAHRERYHFLATFYCWSARHGGWPTLPGNDPLTGRPWNQYSPDANRLARAAYRALAREAFAIARAAGPSPLP